MLQVRNLHVSYDGKPAVRSVSLEIPAGTIGCLLGPSGCGKTTVLRTVAGFLKPAGGEVLIDGRPVAGGDCFVPPERRKVGMVLQDLALFPHLNVAENIAFGLRKESRSERSRRVDALLELIGLAGLGAAWPHELSGGQQQRVAIARAMAPRPKLLLLDEPFSSLDPDLREQLPRELRRIFRDEGVTVLLVTHDQAEAFAMADGIGVMKAGTLEQWGTAYELYHEPTTRFVADFIGEGVLIAGTVLDTHRVTTELGTLSDPAPLTVPSGTEVDVLLRPDDVLHDDDSPLKGRIVGRRFRGAHFLYDVALESGLVVPCLASGHHNHRVGEPIGIHTDIKHLIVFSRREPSER